MPKNAQRSERTRAPSPDWAAAVFNCRWGRGIMGRRARHRCGSRAAQRLSTLEPDREADLGQFGRLSVQQDARIHSRGTYIPYRTPMV